MARYNNIIIMDDLNKENFNRDIPFENIEEDKESIENKKKKLLKEGGEFIFSVLKYFKETYEATNNQVLKELLIKYISWHKIFLFIYQMDLLYNDFPLNYDENEFNSNISDEFRCIYNDIMVNKHEYLDKNTILNRNNIKSDYEDFIGLWCKSFEVENRDILKKRLDTNNFQFLNDSSLFFTEISEKIDFKEDEDINEFEIAEVEEKEIRGRSKTRNDNKSKKSTSKSKSKIKNKNNSKSISRSPSRSRSRSASPSKLSEKEKEKQNKFSKTKKKPSKKNDNNKLRDPLPLERKLNEISYSIMKMLLYWKSDKDKLYVVLKAFPSFTDININYKQSKNHVALTTYGYIIISNIYIAMDLISLKEGMAVNSEKVELLKDSGKVMVCSCFENIDIDDIVVNINKKGIPIKYIVYLWQILFQLMEWPLFLKVSQVIQKYYEIFEEEDFGYKKLFQLEWSIYVNISHYFINLEKKNKNNVNEENKTKKCNQISKKGSKLLRGSNNIQNDNSNDNIKNIIDNIYDIKLYDNLKEEITDEGIENIINNLKFGVHSLYSYIKFAIRNQMGCIHNINAFVRIIWHYCLRLYPEKQNYKCICEKNVIVIVKLCIICINVYKKYYSSYVNPILYSKIVQQYILIILNNNYDYDATEFIKKIKENIKDVDACLYSTRGTSHIYHSLSYNPAVFGPQFEHVTLSATTKSPKKRGIIHSLIHKKYVLYSLMFRIAILNKRKIYYIEKEKKEKEYFAIYKKKLTSYPEFMSKPTPKILETYCGKNNYLRSLFYFQFTVALNNYLTITQKESLLLSSINYLLNIHSEESILFHHVYLNSENMNNHINSDICPPPICVKRSNTSLVFKPLPPRNKNIKPFYYKIFCKPSGIGNVTMSDCSYPGTDEFVLNKTNETEIIINGLKENQKYIVAVAAYDKNKNLLCGKIGAQTTPILVAFPLPILINLSYLSLFASIEGLEHCTECSERYLFDYFVESLSDESELISSFSKEPYWIKKVIIYNILYNIYIYIYIYIKFLFLFFLY